MTIRHLVASLTLLSLAWLAAPAPVVAQGTIRVYVRAAGEESGFAEKGTDDSVMDLMKALRGKKRLTLVNGPAEADLIVEVESRDSHSEVGGVVTYKDSKGRPQSFTTTKNQRAVYATIRVDEYRHQVHGESTTWSGASGKVADQVAKWVDQNLVRLIEKREEHRQQ